MTGRTRKMGPSCFVHERDAIGRVIYLAHPLGGDVDNNLKRAKAWLKFMVDGNPWVAFNTQWIVECELWDDADPEQRRQGLKRCLAAVERCDELWMVGPRISDGMQMERQHAKAFGLRIVDYTHAGLVWPPGHEPAVLCSGSPFYDSEDEEFKCTRCLHRQSMKGSGHGAVIFFGHEYNDNGKGTAA